MNPDPPLALLAFSASWMQAADGALVPLVLALSLVALHRSARGKR